MAEGQMADPTSERATGQADEQTVQPVNGQVRGPATGGPNVAGDAELRELAVRRLRKQRDFRVHLALYLAVNAFLVVIWAYTGAGFFWPAFPIFAWGVGVGANAWDAFARDISEERIRREIERLRR
jgi:hypothetical protein